MSEYHIGRLIRGFRESKNIPQKKLYYGIWQDNQVYKIEGGEREVSKLFVDTLLERMGLSTDVYGYEFTIKEYELFQCRADLLELMEKGKYDEAESLCMEYEKKASKRDKFQKQFIRTIKLIIAMENGESAESLHQEAEQTLFLTVPKFDARKMREYLLSGIERTLVAIQAEALCRIEGKEDEGMQMFYNLLFYMEENCTDLWEQERQIPALVLLMVRWLWKWERYSEIWICEKGIKVLRKSMKLTLLEPLMEYEMKIGEIQCTSMPREIQKEWIEGLEAIEIVRKKNKINGKYEGEQKETSLLISMIQKNTRGQILGETIRRIRKEKGISIEELAEGICEPETLRRIEIGAIRPRQKTYGTLMKKLGQQEYAYHPLICSDDYKMYECYQKVLWYMNRFEYEKAEYEFRKLENGLQNEEKVNYQVMLKLQVVIGEKLNKIDRKEKLRCLKEALEQSVPKEIEPQKWPLNRVEIMLWNNIAITLEELGEREDAIRILKKEKEYYEQNHVKLWNNKREYIMILCNLAIFLGRENRYEEAKELAELGIALSLEWNQGNFLIEYLYIKVWNEEKILEKKGEEKIFIKYSCSKTLKMAYAIARIMKYASYEHLIEEHCKEYYGVSIEEL